MATALCGDVSHFLLFIVLIFFGNSGTLSEFELYAPGSKCRLVPAHHKLPAQEVVLSNGARTFRVCLVSVQNLKPGTASKMEGTDSAHDCPVFTGF